MVSDQYWPPGQSAHMINVKMIKPLYVPPKNHQDYYFNSFFLNPRYVTRSGEVPANDPDVAIVASNPDY